MKLKSLYVQKYKNLSPITIDFDSGNGLTMLVGNNGSGKSNVLEVISGIFHDLYKEKSSRKITCDYTLEYVIDDKNCKIENKSGTLRCYGDKFKSRETFIVDHAPANIIGLYSGEDDRLWTQFYEVYYKAYIQRIKKGQHLNRMRLMLINKYYWNISLLTLLLSNNDTLYPFIKDELGINQINKIELFFNFKKYEDANGLLKTFIDRINPNHKNRIKYTLDELKEKIFYNQMLDADGKILVDANGNILVEDSGINDIEVFRYFVQAFMPKDNKIIPKIDIYINENITLQMLSEGEKKLILVKTVLEILADEKTLILMDEPDAHLHEERKPALYKLMKEYTNRQIVVATHSPIMGQLASETELVMLEQENKKCVILTDEKIEKIKRLSGSSWDVIGKGMILKSKRPLVVFEGKTDVVYAKKALQKLKTNDDKYSKIDVDFMSCGGADNIQFFIQDLLSVITSDKKIIILFDRDNQGKTGAAAITNLNVTDEKITKYNDIKKENLIVSFIPYRDGVTDGDFLIEDYFLWEPTVKRMVEKEIESSHHPIKQLPNLAKYVKKHLEERCDEFSEDEYIGFKSLLDKIYELSMEGEE